MVASRFFANLEKASKRACFSGFIFFANLGVHKSTFKRLT